MIDNPFYSHEAHGDYELISIGQLDLEEGGSIPDCHLAVATFGELNEAKDNAILVTTGLTQLPPQDAPLLLPVDLRHTHSDAPESPSRLPTDRAHLLGPTKRAPVGSARGLRGPSPTSVPLSERRRQSPVEAVAPLAPAYR